MLLLHCLYGDGVARQQEFLLLWMFLGEYGLISFHTLHNVAGVGDGTIMVQRGYSLALEHEDVLSLWKEYPIYNSIMNVGFDMWEVQGWSYEMTGAMRWMELLISR